VFDRRSVSRERVIGISFVDILIQAVFVLLLALIVGYVDPLEKLEIKEYEEVGKDLCKKLNKDSVEACREFIKDKNIGPKTNIEYGVLGEEICKKISEPDPSKCKSAIDEMLGNNNLRPCLKSNSKTSISASLYWNIYAPNDIEFDGFSSEYKLYVKNSEDQLSKVLQLENQKGQRFTSKEVTEKFDFIRENSCFHTHRIKKMGAYTDAQINNELSAIYALRSLRR
jgi:hypothetical protein